MPPRHYSRTRRSLAASPQPPPACGAVGPRRAEPRNSILGKRAWKRSKPARENLKRPPRRTPERGLCKGSSSQPTPQPGEARPGSCAQQYGLAAATGALPAPLSSRYRCPASFRLCDAGGLAAPEHGRARTGGKLARTGGKLAGIGGKNSPLSARGSAKEPGSAAELGGAFPGTLTKGAHAVPTHTS